MLSITIYSAIYYITIYNPRPRALLLLGGLESNTLLVTKSVILSFLRLI